MKYYYIIPSKNFFRLGRGGAVSHAIGYYGGVKETGKLPVFIDGGEGVFNYFEKEEIASRYLSQKSQGFSGFFEIASLSDVLLALKVLFYYSKIEKNILHFRKTWALVVVWLLFPKTRSKMLRNNFVLYEVNGLSVQNASDNFVSRFLKKAVGLLTVRAMKDANLIYVVSDQIKKDLIKLGWEDPESIQVVHNGCPRSVSKDIDNNGSLSLVFYGKFRDYNDYGMLKESAEKLYEKYGEKFRLYVIGFGPMEAEIKSLFGGKEYVRLCGEMGLHDVAKIDGLMKSKTVGVVPLKDAPGSDFLSPIKLFDYFALGFPVLVSSAVSLSNEITSSGVARSYSCCSVDEFVHSASYFYEEACYPDVKKSVLLACDENSWTNRAKVILDMAMPV